VVERRGDFDGQWRALNLHVGIAIASERDGAREVAAADEAHIQFPVLRSIEQRAERSASIRKIIAPDVTPMRMLYSMDVPLAFALHSGDLDRAVVADLAQPGPQGMQQLAREAVSDRPGPARPIRPAARRHDAMFPPKARLYSWFVTSE